MKFWKFCTFSIGYVLLTGCSTSTLFTSYPDKMAPNLNQVNQGQYQQCITSLTPLQKTNDYELYAAELGRIQQLSDNYSASTSTFMPLMTKVEADQMQAKIRGSHVLVTSGSLLTNDNAIPYKLASYEIVFLYQYQALNFIAEGDISDALVAARKSNDLQAYLAQQYQKQLAEAETDAQKNGLDMQMFSDQSAQLKGTLDASASVKNSFANAMSYYLSGLLFLATDDFNNAAVAFQQVVTIVPDNSYAQNMLLTTLQTQGAPTTTINNFRKAFGLSKLPSPAPNKAYVTVMYEQNFVSPRVAVTVPIYMPILDQSMNFSFPTYPDAAVAISPLNVSITNNNKLSTLNDTQLMVNTNALAAKDLMQQYPIIFLRESLRILAKMTMVQVAQNSGNNNNNNNQSKGNLLSALLQAYSNFSDRADLRSWLTLPQDIQVAQYTLNPGDYDFHFGNSGLNADVSQSLEANQYYLIWVTQYGKEIKVQAFSL